MDLPDDVVIPDLAEPIRGYRVWVPAGGHLYSLNNTAWSAEVPMEAECVMPKSPYYAAFGFIPATGSPRYVGGNPTPCDAPPCPPVPLGGDDLHIGYGCGLYAAKTFADLAGVYLMDSDKVRHYIVGEVLLWGKVYDYDKGYRAQYAEPVVLYDNGRPEVAELAQRYGCQVVPFDRKRFRDALRAVYAEELERGRQAQELARVLDRLRETSAKFDRRTRRWVFAARTFHLAVGAFCVAVAGFYAVTGTPALTPVWAAVAVAQAWCARVWKGVL